MKTYLISNGKRIKIGRSRNPVERARMLQTASPQPLTILLELDGDREAELHAHFAQDRVQGEWFHFSEPMRRFIAEARGVPYLVPFFTWLCQQDTRIDDVGRLATIVRQDANFPRGKQSLVQILHRYPCKLPMREAIKDAHREWREQYAKPHREAKQALGRKLLTDAIPPIVGGI